MTEERALAELRALGNRGAYAEAAEAAAGLTPELRSRPAVALQIARNFLRQGHPAAAQRALAEAVLDDAGPGERLIHALETASVAVYRTVAVRAALERADAAFAAVETAAVDPADRAEAERVHVRILLTAATYREIPQPAAAEALARLPDIARRLEDAGRIDEALAARFTHADRQEDARTRIAALERFAAEALAAGRPALAAEAHTLRAEVLLGSGGGSEEILALLASAEALYAEAGHRHGGIDAARVRAKLAIERELAGLDGLEACLDAYRRVEFFRGALTTLMDLSPLAHIRGDTASAARYRHDAIELVNAVEMGLAQDSFRMGAIDLLMRFQRYGEAKELCEAALASDLPRWMHAGYELLLGTIYSFLDDVRTASVHGRRALELYESLGDSDSASDGVQKLANDLAARGGDAAFDEAEALLTRWIDYDDRRKHHGGGAAKREMLAQLCLMRFLGSSSQRGDAALLDRADALLTEAGVRAAQLPPREGAQRLGSLEQIRAQVLQSRGDEAGALAALQKAIAHYDRGGFAMESANCRYLIGVYHLNRAFFGELIPSFGIAESHFREALAYYDSAGMREQAATGTRFMFARLYTNTAPRVAPEVGGQMLDAALGHLRDAETDTDAIRREFDAGPSVVEVQQTKHALVARTQRIAALTLEILCRLRPDPPEAWRHVQRAKARTLVDILGVSTAPPARVLAELESHTDAGQLLLRERELTARVRQAPPAERPALRAELEGVRRQIAGDPRFGEYLELRNGEAIDESDLPSMLGGEGAVCVDWVAEGDRLFLLTARAGGAPRLTPLAATLPAVQAFVQANLAADMFRVNIRNTPEILDELDPLVAPLRDLTGKDELLILSPTGPLHALPLHALRVDGDALIARNPVVYTPSLTVLRHCLARAVDAAEPAALFGDPDGDRAEAAALVAYLEQRFGTKSLLGAEVTGAAFRERIGGRRLVHFQGHAVHNPAEPLASRLELADGKLTARDVFALADLRAELVTLAACESGSTVIAAGDEPLGLIPAFLYAGAKSVLATLWKVNQRSAARLMRLFYDAQAGDGAPDKARILRNAVLELRDTADFRSPYHWAPFVLHGAWH